MRRLPVSATPTTVPAARLPPPAPTPNPPAGAVAIVIGGSIAQRIVAGGLEGRGGRQDPIGRIDGSGLTN